MIDTLLSPHDRHDHALVWANGVKLLHPYFVGGVLLITITYPYQSAWFSG